MGRSVAVVTVAAVGLAAGGALALLPYSAETHMATTTFTVRCGRPAFAWRTEATVTGGPIAGTAGASVEREPLCGKGVTERLALATGVLATATVATAAVAVAGRRDPVGD